MGIKISYYNEDKFGIDNRFIIVSIILILIYAGFMLLFYLKADEITKDPCSICSKYMGKTVFCTTESTIPLDRYYFPNGSIVTNVPEVIEGQNALYKNFTLK